MSGTSDADDLLPRREMDSPAGMARALVWAMNNILPWHAPAPKAGTHVFRSQAELAIVWASHGGAPDTMPKVDFNQMMVVAVFVDAGTYTTGPTIRSIRKEGPIIRVAWHMAPSRMGWPMINPAAPIALPRVDGEVVFEQSPEG